MKMKVKESCSTYHNIIQEIDFLDRKKPTKIFYTSTSPENPPPAVIIFPALFEPVNPSSSPEKSDQIDDPRGVSTDLTLGPNSSKIAVPSKNHSLKKKSRPPRKTNITVKQVQQQQQQPCPMRTLQAIQNSGGSESEPVFLFQKILTASDVDFGLNRIFITGSEKLMGALGEEERRKVEDENSEFRVLTVDPNGEGYELNITWWRCLRMIVLNHEWSKLVGANGLEIGDCVKGWGYRHGGSAGNFRLALDVIKAKLGS